MPAPGRGGHRRPGAAPDGRRRSPRSSPAWSTRRRAAERVAAARSSAAGAGRAGRGAAARGRARRSGAERYAALAPAGRAARGPGGAGRAAGAAGRRPRRARGPRAAAAAGVHAGARCWSRWPRRRAARAPGAATRCWPGSVRCPPRPASCSRTRPSASWSRPRRTRTTRTRSRPLVLDLVPAAVADGALEPGDLPWLADLALPDADDELAPAGALARPGSLAARLLDPDEIGLVHADLVEEFGAETLAAIGVLDGLAAARGRGRGPGRPDPRSWPSWPASGTGRRTRWTPSRSRPRWPVRSLAVRDLDAVRPDAWPEAVAAIASSPRTRPALVQPVRVRDRRGRGVDVAPYTAWWLRRELALDVRVDPAGDPGLAALLEPAPAWVAGLDEQVRRALGVVRDLTELGGAAVQLVLDRSAEPEQPVDLPTMLRLWAWLAGEAEQRRRAAAGTRAGARPGRPVRGRRCRRRRHRPADVVAAQRHRPSRPCPARSRLRARRPAGRRPAPGPGRGSGHDGRHGRAGPRRGRPPARCRAHRRGSVAAARRAAGRRRARRVVGGRRRRPARRRRGRPGSRPGLGRRSLGRAVPRRGAARPTRSGRTDLLADAAFD